MNLTQKILHSTWKIFQALQKESARAVFTGEKVGAEVQKARIKICETCANFNSEERKCNLCGCFMDVKTELKTQLDKKGFFEVTHCPDGLWGIMTDEDGTVIDDVANANYYRAIKGEPLIKK